MAIALPVQNFSLQDKYTKESGTVFLSGTQALVRLPLDQHRADRRRGLHTATYITGYRGSPLGGYDQLLEREAKLLKEHDVVFQSGLNEDLSATAIFGSQMLHAFPKPKYDGVVGIWYGKAPGVDRSGDAFKHGNYAGTGRNGGVLALGGDDPLCKSSTLPSHSEVAFYDALMPTLYPGNAQEILDLGLHGIALSRASGLWAGMKIVTNVADEAGTAEVSVDRVNPIIPIVEFDGKPYEHQINLMAVPPHSVEMERTLHGVRLEIARQYAWENKLNQIAVPTRDAWLGILTAGKTYYDVREALRALGITDDVLEHHGIRILKMGLLFPFEQRIVREFARGLEEIVVVEEKRAFLETWTRDALYGQTDQPRIVGKRDERGQPLFQAHGELDADLIARAIAKRIERKLPLESVEARVAYLDEVKSRPIQLSLARTPYFCSGCPHNRSTVVPDGMVAAGGIGCHAMAVWMDRDIIGATQMGAEGAQWVGLAPFTETPHIFQNIGDGTYFHSGSLAFQFAIASGTTMTYKLLYNSAVAMTGGQDAVGALPIPDLTRKLEAEGVKKIVVTTDDPHKYRGVKLAPIAEVRHRDDIIAVQEELAQIPGVTVLIHDQQCAAEKRRLRKRDKQPTPTTRVYINERVCEGCGDCGRKSNCLSVQPVDTEFGRKTQIHQSSCNQDYSCLLGHCPSFLTVEVPEGTKPKERRFPAIDRELPEPELVVPEEGFTLHMMGIGGTGVVTVNQVLGTAALLDGRQVRGLDQTGLSQKGGPVVSDLKIFSRDADVSNKAPAGGADLYLGFDILVAATPNNLDKADPHRTVAVISTSKVPTGKMVSDTGTKFPDLATLTGTIDSATRADRNVYLDAQDVAEGLFGDHMAGNVLLLGAAYQAGALPISAAAIEQAIGLNGVAIEMNRLAFQWGRLAVIDPEAVRQAAARTRPHSGGPRRPSAAEQAVIDATGVAGEARRLLEIRVPELADYQNLGYARQYADFVQHVSDIEQARTPGRTRVTEAVARYLYKLMAYKDEYEVARLHTDPLLRRNIEETFGENVKVAWHLQPPILEKLGRTKKTKFGAWFLPGYYTLRAMKRLRGTPLDVFGRTQIRQLERSLIGEYRALVERGLRHLSDETYDTVVALAELPDLIRGYEEVKREGVTRYRAEADQLQAKLAEAGPTPVTEGVARE